MIANMKKVESYPKRPECAKWCLIPQRYVMAVMLFLGLNLAFMTRVCLGEIFSHILKSEEKVVVTRRKNFCNVTDQIIAEKEFIAKRIEWDPKARLYFSKCFFYGYLVGHLPGGYLADRYGGKWFFGMPVLLSGLMAVATPHIILYSPDHVIMTIMSFVRGIVQAPLIPAICSIVGRWGGRGDRGKMMGIALSATQIGNFVNKFCTHQVMEVSWIYVFYLYGGLALLWSGFWFLLCFSYPHQNPYIRLEEYKYLKKELARQVQYGEREFPWKKMFTSITVWAMIVVHLGHSYAYHSLIVDMPRYSEDILNMNTPYKHKFSSIPFGIMGCFTIFLGFLSDFLINRNYITLNTARKSFSTVGAMGPGIFLLCVSFTGCVTSLSLVMVTMAMSFMSFAYASVRINPLDLAPNYGGCLMALGNGMGAFAVLCQEYGLSKVVIKRNLQEWRIFFLITLGVLAATNLVFLLLGTAKVQPWNFSKRKRKGSHESY